MNGPPPTVTHHAGHTGPATPSAPTRRDDLSRQPADAAWRCLLVVLSVSLILGISGLLVATLGVLLLVFGGVLVGILLNGITRWASGFLPLSYRTAYTLVVVLLLALVTVGFYYMGSQLAAQVSELSAQLRASAERVTAQLREYPWARPYLNGSQVDEVVTGRVVPSVMNGLEAGMWAVSGVVIIVAVGLYLAYDPKLYSEGLCKLFPMRHRRRFQDAVEKLRTTLGYWIVGRLLSMTIVGVLTATGLWLLGVPLSITLGILAALLTFIPNIGPILAAVPQALLATQVGINTVFYVLLFNVGLQAVESYLITPVIQRYQVMLPPAVTISVQVLLGVVIGTIGVIMAAPLTAALMILIQMLYVREYLDDPHPGRLLESS